MTSLVGSKSHKRVHFGPCSDCNFSIMVQLILKTFTDLKLIQGLHFLFCNILDIFAPWPRKCSSSGPTVVYALRRWLIAIFSFYFCALHKLLVSPAALLSWSNCSCKSMHGHALTFSKQVIASIIYDSCCWITSRFALPPSVGGLSCL